MSEALRADAHIEPPDAGESVQVGTPFVLVVEASHPAGGIAILPEAVDLGEALGERRFARRHVRKVEAGAEIDIYRLELIPFEAGELTIPAIPLALGSTVAETPELVLTVETTFAEAELAVATSTQPEALAVLEEMAAPDPPARRVEVFDPTLFWAIGAAALVGLVAYFVLRRRKSKPEAVTERIVEPPRPAHEVALQALEELRTQDLMARGEYKQHYTELSMILRAYLGRRYGFESVELTLDELLDALRGRASKELEVDTLMKVLASADHIKFAKRVPNLGEGYEDLERACRLVNQSAPVPTPPANNEMSE